MLHKKYITNGSFRNLVRYFMALGSSRRSVSQWKRYAAERMMNSFQYCSMKYTYLDQAEKKGTMA